MTNVYDKEYERILKRSIKRKYGYLMKDIELYAYGPSLQYVDITWVDVKIKNRMVVRNDRFYLNNSEIY